MVSTDTSHRDTFSLNEMKILASPEFGCVASYYIPWLPASLYLFSQIGTFGWSNWDEIIRRLGSLVGNASDRHLRSCGFESHLSWSFFRRISSFLKFLYYPVNLSSQNSFLMNSQFFKLEEGSKDMMECFITYFRNFRVHEPSFLSLVILYMHRRTALQKLEKCRPLPLSMYLSSQCNGKRNKFLLNQRLPIFKAGNQINRPQKHTLWSIVLITCLENERSLVQTPCGRLV